VSYDAAFLILRLDKLNSYRTVEFTAKRELLASKVGTEPGCWKRRPKVRARQKPFTLEILALIRLAL
jgi:hypothetical protein